MTQALLLTLKLSVVALIFAIGLGSTARDLSYLWRRPRQLARSLLAMYVAVPVAILLLTKLLPMTPQIRTAVLVLAISAGAPLLPRKLMKLGREGYVFSLVVTSSLLAIVAVPLWVELIAAAFGRDASVDSLALAGLIAKALFAPLLVGMLVRPLLAAQADRTSDAILFLAGAVLTAAGLALLVLDAPLLLEAGLRPLMALLGMTVVALLLGHLLGGPDPGDRTALAVACATRHVGIALLAAASAPGPKTATLVVAYILTSAIVSGVYLKWRSSPRATEASATS